MTTLERLQQHLAMPIEKIRGYKHKRQSPLLECKDGTTMSVQASLSHYCTPQDDVGPYTRVEIWCCGEVEAWAEYGTGEDPYAYVPIELVVQEIDRRGGFKEQQNA